MFKLVEKIFNIFSMLSGGVTDSKNRENTDDKLQNKVKEGAQKAIEEYKEALEKLED